MNETHQTQGPLRRLACRRTGFLFGAFFSVALLLIGSGIQHELHAQAPKKGNAPSVSWGGFLKPYGENICLSMAQQSLQQDGLKIVGASPLLERAGQNANVVILVTCAPIANNQTRIVVIATSTDINTANYYRDDIRNRIQRQVLIDNGSAGVPATH